MTQYTLTKKKRKLDLSISFFFSFGWSDKYTILVKQGYLAPPVDYAIHAIFFSSHSISYAWLFFVINLYTYIERERENECAQMVTAGI